MSQPTIRTALRTALRAVSGVGLVHEFVRIGNAASFGPEHFIVDGTVNAWFFAVVPAKTRLAFSEKESAYRFRIRGFLSANDENESLKDAADLANSIADALFTNTGLSAVCDWSDPVEVVDPIDTRKVAIGEGEYLCHIVELRFTAYERATVTYT